MTRKSTFTSAVESAEVGSSMIRIRASSEIARAISTTCCWPRRRSLTSELGSIASSRRAKTSVTTCDSAAWSTKAPRTSSRPMNRLSVTDRFGQRLSSWWMIATPRDTACAGESKTTGSPKSSKVPVVDVSTPARIFISVDLPAPFSPNSAVTAPARISKSTPRKAWVPPYVFVIARAVMTTPRASGCRPAAATVGAVGGVTVRPRASRA